MNTQVNPDNIQERADKLAAPDVDAEAAKVAADKVAADAKVVADKATADIEAAKVAAAKGTESKPEISKQPNDPAELRKWATKASQENAALRDEMKAIKAALEKMTKKQIDYKELAKNPEAIQKQIELERQEATEEMQTLLEEKSLLATKNETVVEKMKREQDKEHYPEWARVFPLVQNLAANTDGRINFNKAPGDVLDDLYALALQLSPVIAPVVPVVPAVVPPVVATKTAEETAADIVAAEKRGFEKAQEAMRLELNGQGIGSAGKGGRRSSGLTKDALHEMPLGDLKKLISQE